MKARFLKMSLWLVAATSLTRPLFALNEEETKKVIVLVDERQRNTGDYTSSANIEEWEKKKDKKAKEPYELKKAFEARIYRRDVDDQLIILFTKPKAEAGKGYLRKDKTLLLYEPALGKWERQTERASIAGTGSRRDDFDESRLAEEYKTVWVADEKLGKYQVHHFKLTTNAGVDVASPVLELWVDADSKNIMKREEFALSGKLTRRMLYPGWEKMFSKSKGGDVYVPKEIYVYDMLEDEKMTKIKILNVDLNSLEKNMFTKAWIESQSR